MQKLTRDDLYSLEQYAEKRLHFRAQVLAHKKHRKVHVGPVATLYFEDRMTMQYQIQEMLRAEKIFTAEGIHEELDSYKPLIPDGTNWKVTMMVEYPDPKERKAALEQLVGIEDRVWAKVGEGEQIYAIADEDMERSNDIKTSAVHFLRFELPQDVISLLKGGADLHFGVDHARYDCQQQVSAEMCESLIADLA